MSDLANLIGRIHKLSNCKVYESVGQVPLVENGHNLPVDVVEFYMLCNGIDLFTGRNYPYYIVSYDEFVRANPVIMGCHWIEYEEDISSGWYTVVKDPEYNYLTIDLHPNRLGRCYDSYPGIHAVRNECIIIALSFTELLTRLIENQGAYPYWLSPTFESLGNA